MPLMKYLETKNKYVPYALVAPAVLIVLFVVFIPVLNAVLMSFQNYDLRRPKEIGFIGMKNYIDMCADPLFWGALLRTIAWVGFGVGFQFLFGSTVIL